MNLKHIASAAVLAVAASACQQIPDEMSVVEFCSNPNNLNKDVCKVNVEIDGQKRALAETNMTCRPGPPDRRERACPRQRRAGDRRQGRASGRRPALRDPHDPAPKTGSCSPGYKLISCTQTRYTYQRRRTLDHARDQRQRVPLPEPGSRNAAALLHERSGGPADRSQRDTGADRAVDAGPLFVRNGVIV